MATSNKPASYTSHLTCSFWTSYSHLDKTILNLDFRLTFESSRFMNSCAMAMLLDNCTMQLFYYAIFLVGYLIQTLIWNNFIWYILQARRKPIGLLGMLSPTYNLLNWHIMSSGNKSNVKTWSIYPQFTKVTWGGKVTLGEIVRLDCFKYAG